MSEILVVDDERIIRVGMKTLLLGEGFEVRTARDGEEAMKKIAEHRPDLVLLDVMMPKVNGFQTCEMIRERDKTIPVIFLTAKFGEVDQVRGLDLGADDYVAKDASEAVLMARIRRALERTMVAGDMPADRDILRIGSVRIDLELRNVIGDSGYLARLTQTEADILRLLASRRGYVFSPNEVIMALRGDGFACEDSMLYVHISNLRRKLGPAAKYIVNDRLAGYRLLVS